MEKMSTLLAFIILVVNTASLTGILSLAFNLGSVNYSLASLRIVAIISYLFILSLLSSFCLTDNECCGSCCPANKCCLCEKGKKNSQSVEVAEGEGNKGKKEPDCCAKFCDCLYDCLFIPIGGCIRRIGKQGTRYFSVITLCLVHVALIALCFYEVSKTNETMNGNTVGIVIISGIIIVANLFSMIAPCFNCSDKFRYKEKGEKEQKKDDKENKIKDEEIKQDDDVVQVKNALDAALIENKQNNEYNNNKEISEDKNKQEHTDETNKNDLTEKIENAKKTISTVEKINNAMNDFGKVFGVNKNDSNNIKKEE